MGVMEIPVSAWGRIQAKLPEFQTVKDRAWQAGGFGANLFLSTTEYLRTTAGAKNLLGRPLELLPHWLFKITTISPDILRPLVELSRVKVLFSGIDAFTKVESDLYKAPPERRSYCVVGLDTTYAAQLDYSKEERRLRKVGQIASWLMSVMEFTMYLKNSTLLSLSSQGLQRVLWITTVVGTIASIQGIYSESRFVWQNYKPQQYHAPVVGGEETVDTTFEAKLSRIELGSSMLKIANHVSCLCLAILFSLPLFGYAPAALYTAKLVALTSMSLFTIISYYWEKMAVGKYDSYPVATKLN